MPVVKDTRIRRAVIWLETNHAHAIATIRHSKAITGGVYAYSNIYGMGQGAINLQVDLQRKTQARIWPSVKPLYHANVKYAGRIDVPAFFDDVIRHVSAAQQALAWSSFLPPCLHDWETLRSQNLGRNKMDGTWDFDAAVVTEGLKLFRDRFEVTVENDPPDGAGKTVSRRTRSIFWPVLTSWRLEDAESERRSAAWRKCFSDARVEAAQGYIGNREEWAERDGAPTGKESWSQVKLRLGRAEFGPRQMPTLWVNDKPTGWNGKTISEGLARLTADGFDNVVVVVNQPDNHIDEVTAHLVRWEQGLS